MNSIDQVDKRELRRASCSSSTIRAKVCPMGERSMSYRFQISSLFLKKITHRECAA